MLKREYGRIINVASIAGLNSSVRGPHYAGYAATTSAKSIRSQTRPVANRAGGASTSSLTRARIPAGASAREYRCERVV